MLYALTSEEDCLLFGQLFLPFPSPPIVPFLLTSRRAPVAFLVIMPFSTVFFPILLFFFFPFTSLVLDGVSRTEGPGARGTCL